MSRLLTRVAVLLPVLVLAASIVRSEIYLGDQRSFRLPVEGYDPRDLLRGRYLRYRVKRDAPPLEACEGDDCCLCLSTSQPPRAATCHTARAQCEGALPERHLDGLRRYYVPEARARQLERRFIDAAAEGRAHIVMTLDSEGRPHVRYLELRGQRID